MSVSLPNSTLVALFLTSVATATIIRVPQDRPTIQAGIDAAMDRDTVLVDTGRYVENINFSGKNIVVGSLFLTTGDTSYLSQTVIDGNNDDTVVKFENGENSSCSLIGFTITGGYPWRHGGGIICNKSAPTLISLIITNNRSGASVAVDGLGFGGGIYCVDASPKIIDTIISENYTSGGWFHGGSGGGIYLVDSNPVLENVLISGNYTGQVGGGIYCENSSPVLINCSVADNSFYDWSVQKGGRGIYLASGSQAIILNTIIWGLEVQDIRFHFEEESNRITVSHSDIQGGKEGIVTNENGTVQWLEGNIRDDPLFLDSDSGNYDLDEDSPCVDTGTARFIWGGDTLINLKSEEYVGTAPDMGAFESPYRINYFPLSIGDERQYYYVEDFSGDSVFTPIHTVYDTASFNGKTYFSYRGLFYHDTAYVRTDVTGDVYVHVKTEEEQPDESILFKFNVAEGDTYMTKPVCFNSYICMVNVVSRNDTVTSRAGSFPNCIQYWIQGPAMDADLRYWIAPEVGIVAIAGSWELFSTLYYARVGEIFYPPGPLAISELWSVSPLEYRLEANYPNPFNPTTTLEFLMPQSGWVTLTVHNLLGKEVTTLVDSWQEAGRHPVQWDASKVASGIYFVRMQSQGFTQVRKVTVLR